MFNFDFSLGNYIPKRPGFRYYSYFIESTPIIQTTQVNLNADLPTLLAQMASIGHMAEYLLQALKGDGHHPDEVDALRKELVESVK